jgi:hypothetical protein
MIATPETMVHDVTQEFQALIDDVTNEESRHRTAYEVERTLFRRLLALGAALLRLFFTSRAATRPSEPRTTPTGRRMRYTGMRATTYVSVFGTVRFARHYYTAPGQPGTTIEGLYFLRSDCNRPLMTLAGNLVTDFNFHTAPIHLRTDGPATLIQVDSPDAPGYAALRPDVPAHLPPASPFASLDEAAAFLKYQPAGIFLARPGVANVVHITRDEAAWQSRLVHVEAAAWAYLHDQPVIPEICYQVEPIAYQWNRGRTYQLEA